MTTFRPFASIIGAFPIGLLVVFILEIHTIGGKRKGPREGVNWIIYIGAGFVVFSALFGWFLKT